MERIDGGSRFSTRMKLLGGVLIAACAVAILTASSARSATATTITVTAGKPTEFSFKLSKTDVTAGKVTFKFVNGGKIPHSFELCSSPKATSGNSCSGHKTAVLKPGKSASFTLTLKNGIYEYLCTVPGHAAAGMKGLFGVGMKPGKIGSTTGATTTTTTTTGGGTTTTGGGTTTPVGTTTTAPPAGGAALIGDPVAGAQVFATAGCAGCHTLKAAGATGTVGPNLDEVAPDQPTVVTNVTYGNAMGMPAFGGPGGTLSTTQINNVAAYVYQSTHT
jgi:mono/diheme cytochrome c family protein